MRTEEKKWIKEKVLKALQNRHSPPRWHKPPRRRKRRGKFTEVVVQGKTYRVWRRSGLVTNSDPPGAVIGRIDLLLIEAPLLKPGQIYQSVY